MPAKLEYRLLNSNDVSLIFNFNSSIENLSFVPRSPSKTIDEAQVLLDRFLKSMKEKTSFWWTFGNTKSGKQFGYAGLFGIDVINRRAEIGYGLLKEYWGKGFASSVVETTTRYGFEKLSLHRIYGLVDPENKASIRVLEKNGYVSEGIMRDYYYARGKYFDMCLMAKIEK